MAKGKPDLSDKKSAWASAFNAAARLVQVSDEASNEEIADDVVDLTIALYEARISAQKELKLGGAEGNSGGGGGGNSGRSGGSNRSSGGSRSSGPTDNQTEYYSDIADRISADGGKIKPSLKKFKELSYDKAKLALEDAIDEDPGK